MEELIQTLEYVCAVVVVELEPQTSAFQAPTEFGLILTSNVAQRTLRHARETTQHVKAEK